MFQLSRDLSLRDPSSALSLKCSGFRVEGGGTLPAALCSW